ncbi:YbaN family protein [Reinekea marinisedimentorum]|uniref:Inner membrane protein n=1 Tax=Reinekea marinisedimentorum TaxID=230495 RepID=A0A4R3I5A1_9GAMM|nr:YbaN family protein [Reinekea marinisedimentorum]TCS39955.1 hypothetical protein BCF53_11145 [Reinekea marinisedimentorum]
MNPVKRHAIFAAGWLSLVLGAIGVLLPLVPTTPFLLISAACFAETSPRFHRWLLNSPMFGPIIANWQNENFIEKRTKKRVLIIICLTFGMSIFIVGIPPLQWMLVGIMIVCLLVVSRLPTVPRSLRNKDNGAS